MQNGLNSTFLFSLSFEKSFRNSLIHRRHSFCKKCHTLKKKKGGRLLSTPFNPSTRDAEADGSL